MVDEPVRIIIEYRRKDGEVFRLINTVSSEAYHQDLRVIEFAAKSAGVQFAHELEMELANQQYAPKPDRFDLTGKFNDPSLATNFYRGANA